MNQADWTVRADSIAERKSSREIEEICIAVSLFIKWGLGHEAVL